MINIKFENEESLKIFYRQKSEVKSLFSRQRPCYPVGSSFKYF